AEVLDQPPRPSRAQTRRQSQCQPLQYLFGRCPFGYGSQCRHGVPPSPVYALTKKGVKGEPHTPLLESNITMSRLRISAISFLNTVPLMWDFEHGPAGKDFEISYTLPSACAAQLQAGTADIGIIPAAAYTQIPELAIVPGVAIAARRPVRSILLLCKVPLDDVRTVALDTSSMTSVALTKV